MEMGIQAHRACRPPATLTTCRGRRAQRGSRSKQKRKGGVVEPGETMRVRASTTPCLILHPNFIDLVSVMRSLFGGTQYLLGRGYLELVEKG